LKGCGAICDNPNTCQMDLLRMPANTYSTLRI
jgi:hypothetical protein